MKSIRNWTIRKHAEDNFEYYEDYTEKYYRGLLQDVVKEQVIVRKALETDDKETGYVIKR